MNTRILLPLLAGLASMAWADLVPVLSEPRSIPLNVISYDAWGDTLIAARTGITYRIVRKGDQVVLVDSIVSDSIRSEMPRTLQTNKGYHLQVSSSWLLALDWPNKPGTNLHSISLGYNRATGDLFRGTNDTLMGYICSNSVGYFVKEIDRTHWVLKDTMRAMGDTSIVCSVDPLVRRVAYAKIPASSTEPSRIYRGDASSGFNLGYDTATIHPTALFAAYDDAWLAYDDALGLVRLGGLGQESILYPTELATLNDKYVAPVRKDSLMVFGGDSTLVLAGWTRNKFQVYQTIKLDNRINYAMALGDSTLWIQSNGKILSFRISWENRSSSSIHRAMAVSGALQVRQDASKLLLTWNGDGETSAQLIGINGRVLAQPRLAPGKTTEISLSGHHGLYLIRTNSETMTIMVR